MIPARYESGRFPGKPLVDILGKPMVVRTWEQAKKAKRLDRVVIATDDDRIADVCRKAGAEVIMTSKTCPNGKVSTLECILTSKGAKPSHKMKVIKIFSQGALDTGYIVLFG